MAQFWIADLHFGHEKVAKMRGFESSVKHDVEIFRQIESLRAGDRLWVLGDISSGRENDESYALALLGSVQAELHLIAGNHDSVSSIHRNGFKKQREWLEVFDSVQQFGQVRFNKEDILMSHFPYARSGDGPGRGEGRYNEFRLPALGHPLIHGHTHHSEPHMPFRMGEGVDMSQFCVSWDAHRRLVTEKDILNWREKANDESR